MAAPDTRRLVCSTSCVSILVLVDWRWRHAGIHSRGNINTLFQSLFWWIGDGGESEVDTDLIGNRVSILVLVDWRWRPDIRPLARPAPTRFQSLFWWIGDGGYIGTLLSETPSAGFNPCSGGLEMAATPAGR